MGSKVESSVSLRGILTRFDVLRCEIGITDYTSFLGDSSFKNSSLVTILHGIIDKCLSMLSVSEGLEESSVESLSFLIDQSIKVSIKDLFFFFKNQVYDQEVENKNLYEEISQNAERLIAICEAIITSDDSDGLKLPLGLKFSCVNNLTTLLIFFNSNISHVGKSGRVMSEMVQCQIAQILEKSLISFGVLPLKSTSYFNELAEKRIDPGEMKLEIHQEILKSLVQYMQLLNHSIIGPKFGSVFLKYFSLSDPEKDLNRVTFLNSKPIIMNMFGKTWNELTEMVIKSLLNQKFKDVIAMRNIDEKSEEKLNSMCRFIFRGLDAALELYLTDVIQSLDPVRCLAKTIISQIKNWPKYMENGRNENLIALQSSIYTYFSKSCSNLIANIDSFTKMDVRSNRRLSIVSDLTFDYDDGKAISIQCRRTSLEEINAVWPILGGIGGAMRHAFDTIGIGFSQFGDM